MPAHAFYRFFTGDYLRDAGHLSLLEHGCYRRLIDLYMVTRQPLPFDMPRLYRLLHATSKEEQQAVQVVIEEFFHMDRGVLRHSRCDRELQWQDGMSQAQAERAKLSWESRRKNNELHAGALPDHSSGNASQSQSQNKDIKDTPASPGVIIPPCPILKIRETYNEMCPLCTRSKVPTATLQGHISARWRQLFSDGAAHDYDGAAEFFREFFARVHASRFLTGRAKARDGGKPFRASLRWLMKPENFAKTIEGEYDDELQRQT